MSITEGGDCVTENMSTAKIVNVVLPISLRDWFAGMVLGGQWEGRYPVDMREPTNVHKVVETCYALADAMLAERDKQETPDEPD